MNKILLLALLLSTSVFAQPDEARDASEEAIILNQELQFLEDTANNVSVSARAERTSPNPVASPTQVAAQPIETGSLEVQYFGSESEAPIRTRAAAPKRRGN